MYASLPRISILSSIQKQIELSSRPRVNITIIYIVSQQKHFTKLPSSSHSIFRECVSSEMEIQPSSIVVVVGFRTAPLQLNLPETQYLLSVRKTHGLAGSSGAHCKSSCNAFAESTSARCITLNLPVGRPDITSLVFDTHRVFRDKTFAETILLISSIVEFMYVPC